MYRHLKTLAVVLVALALAAQVVNLAQARFARGGQQDTFYEIRACKDGLRLDIGYQIGEQTTPPTGFIEYVENRRDFSVILGRQDFVLDGGPATIEDSEHGVPILLSHTATVVHIWADESGAPLPALSPGSRIRLRNVQLQFVNLANYFDAIVQDCLTTDSLPDRSSRVFYPAGGDAQNPGNDVPNVTIAANSVVTSVIPVTFNAGQVVVDVNVGMYIYRTGFQPNQTPIEVFLTSPNGSRLKLFGNVDSGFFGGQSIDLQNAEGPDLVRDLMPDFVLDDDSFYGFNDTRDPYTTTPPFNVEAIRPDQSLGQLAGENPNGDWILEINNAGGSTFNLDSWALDMEVQTPSPQVTGVNAAVSSAISDHWAGRYLVDGVVGSVWSSNAHYAHMQEAEWAVVVLPRRADVDRLRIIPRANYVDTTSTLGFPKDFLVQYAIEGSDERGEMTCNPADGRFGGIANWRPLLTYFGYAQPTNAPIDFPFMSHAVDCIRVLGTELSQDDYGSRLMQFAELELYVGESKVTTSQAVVSSAITDDWAGRYLIDGAVGSVWSSNAHYTHMQEAEWAVVVLPRLADVDRLRVIPRANYVDITSTLGFPKDFLVQYAFEGSDERGAMTCNPADGRFGSIANWRPLLTYFGYAQPTNAPIDFPFGSHAVECIRILGTELSQDDYGSRLMQFAELELYNGGSKLVPDRAVVSSAITDQWAGRHLIDGDPGSVWSSNPHYIHMQESEWAVMVLPQRTEVNRLRIIPRANYVDTTSTLGFPKDFLVQYAIEGSDDRGEMTCNPTDGRFGSIANWRPLLTYFGYAQPANAPIDFPFGSHAVECIRILGTELSQDDYGSRLMQFADLELYAR